ncbi:gliding motility-associated C-terminal domain-containing protein [Hymenobacter sp. DH14]|uniref:Gliding motility-associated C-terminal domain-containing protein n=1 Tax=Hymenobacter cyanobacteriorum TaxID=2926463 RepID=A0A9X1VG23_9BACT|nr:gliding motility-associated C-terminal domain-containing protein [Hymenobacter cyanobacteriorum]MCI1188251.1 gliding motility-associated C-terminal domain-containing protein [Hymenobacter cyanobacteriorum]
MTLPFRFVGRALCLAVGLMLPLAAQAVSAGPEGGSLEFIRNQGQWDEHVRYAAALPSGRLFVQPTGLTYAFYDPAFLDQHHRSGAGAPAPAGPANGAIAAHAYSVSFEKASPKARLTASEVTPGERNYFVGNDEQHWASHVRAYRQLRYADLWPGIDLTLYENQTQRLEYDVLLAPRANPARVALRYDGASALSLDAAGNLVIKTTVSTTTELAPQAWQFDANGRRQNVACRYVLADHTVRFVLGKYDASRALTIDPTVQFSTLTGSRADNWGFTATYDNAGNMYSGGIAFDIGFPTTTGAFQTFFAALADIALIKYNTTVSGPAARVWATYLGGTNTEFPHSLVVNGQNELVLLGSTSSRDYPTTTGVVQPAFRGGPAVAPFGTSASFYYMPNGADLVLTRLRADGGALLASTYLGGTGNDGVITSGSPVTINYGDAFRSDVLLDGAGNVYVAASTSSAAGFPGLASGFGATYQGGPSDGVVCKLTPDLRSVLWAGLLGGSGQDAAFSVQRDAQGRVFVCGGTSSANFPATAGSYHPTAPGGSADGFVARISADGRTLERATYLGTSSTDLAQLLQLDAAGNPYVFGQSIGSYPNTLGLAGTVGGPQFIQKLDADLAVSQFSITFGNRSGGGPNLVPTAFLVDDCERVYISGWGGADNAGYFGGNTNGLPVTPGAVQPTTDGSDFYLAEFAPGLTKLEYATFFGEIGGVGEHVDGGTSRFDKRGVVYQAVCASCRGTQGFPQPPGAGTYTIHNGSSNCNNGAFKMNFEVLQADPGPRRFVCLDGGPVALGGAPAGGTWTGPGVQAAPGGGFRFVPTAVGPGQYVIGYTVATTGICVSTRYVRYVVAPPMAPTLAALPDLCTTQAAVALVATPAGGTFSGPGVSNGRFDPAVAGAGLHTLTYAVVDSLGCGSIARQVLVVSPSSVDAGPPITLCADQQQPFQLQGYSPAGGTWSGTGVTAGGFFTPPNTNNRGGVFSLTYTVRAGPCQATATRTVVLAPVSAQNVGLNLPVCNNHPQYAGLAPFNCPLTPVLLAPNATYEWDFGDGTPLSTEATPTHLYQQPGQYRIRLTARYGNCQVLTGFSPIEVGEMKIPNIITPNRDSLNETFRPRFSCQPTSLEVYSRWGQRVYQSDDYHNDWDARNLPDGIYYFLLRDANGRRQKSWLEVRH